MLLVLVGKHTRLPTILLSLLYFSNLLPRALVFHWFEIYWPCSLHWLHAALQCSKVTLLVNCFCVSQYYRPVAFKELNMAQTELWLEG